MPPVNTNQVKLWLLTIPAHCFVPFLPAEVCWIKGQLEEGAGGFIHWQIIIQLRKKARLAGVIKIFGPYHAEATRSEAAEEYVWKEDTRVAGTQFELGSKNFNPSSKVDWARQLELVKAGDLDNVDAGVYIRCFSQISRIRTENLRPKFRGVQQVNVYWGVSGAGKTHRVFDEAGETFYLKSSTTKWFDSYRQEENIIMDEFTGTMAIVHMLKWLDSYPMSVEIKGGQVALNSKVWWITSNIDPNDWYNDTNSSAEQRVALRRRFTNVVHFTGAWGGIMNK